jgi:hypothetical protein
MELSKLIMRLADDERCAGVPLRRDGMHDNPVPSRIGKAAILVECAILGDQRFWICKVSIHRTAFTVDGCEDKCAPRMGAEFFLHVSWSAEGHFFPWFGLSSSVHRDSGCRT